MLIENYKSGALELAIKSQIKPMKTDEIVDRATAFAAFLMQAPKDKATSDSGVPVSRHPHNHGEAAVAPPGNAL